MQPNQTQNTVPVSCLLLLLLTSSMLSTVTCFSTVVFVSYQGWALLL
jgi:hypothetical protein